MCVTTVAYITHELYFGYYNKKKKLDFIKSAMRVYLADGPTLVATST